MCRSMADIQSATAEIRRGKKEERRNERNHRAKKYNGQPAVLHRAAITMTKIMNNCFVTGVLAWTAGVNAVTPVPSEVMNEERTRPVGKIQGCRGYEISHPYPYPYPQIFCGYPWISISMDIHGYPWISMDPYPYISAI